MNLNQNNVNEFLNKYINIVNTISNKYGYHSNIKHLLYLIIPAFVIRYGYRNESIIIECFEKTRIYTSISKDKYIQAYFDRDIALENGKYVIKKHVMLNDFFNSSYISVIDSLIHEFNHAINSTNNEIKTDDKFIYLRTGLSYIKYLRSDLKNAREKSSDVVLEEIINTKQTEEIFNIIIEFSKYDIENIEFSNTLLSLNRENGSLYKSNAYELQSYICKELIKNKTFIPTIENLRFHGEIDGINLWFNNIVGERGMYERMLFLLNKISRQEYEYSNSKWFKSKKLKKIRNTGKMISDIVFKFDKACVYK